MAEQVCKAVYERGIFKPLESVELPERQQVTLTIRPAPSADADAELDEWQQVYEGLSDQDIDEIESITLDRRHFMAQKE
ncbi:MAG: antitoxin family protein [bacterium]|nr:antitoxin family protein [bacterium]